MEKNISQSPSQVETEGISLQENLENRHNSKNWAKPNRHSIRKNWVILVSFVIALFAFSTCEKHNDGNSGNGNGDDNGGGGYVETNYYLQNPPKSGDVYVVGYEGRYATTWKNGELFASTDENGIAATSSIYISGKDVYETGTSGNETSQHAILWKNGVVENLTKFLYYGSNYCEKSTANSVFVWNNNVYVAGSAHNTTNVGYGRTYPILWKNGDPQNVSVSHSMVVSSNSVYVFRGNVYVAIGGYGLACLWENGEAQLLNATGEAN